MESEIKILVGQNIHSLRVLLVPETIKSLEVQSIKGQTIKKRKKDSLYSINLRIFKYC